MDTTLQVDDPRAFPEGCDFEEALRFDPADPHSVAQMQRLLQARLGLAVAPVLCSPPEPGLFTRLYRSAAELLAALA